MKPRRLKLLVPRSARPRVREARPALSAWRPLALCWKLPPPRAPVTRVSPRVQHLRQNFQTQVHWHLGVIAASAPGAVNTSSPSITPALMRAAGHTLVELRRISQRREHSLQMTERVRRERLTIIEPMPAHGRQRVADAVPHARSRVSAAEPRSITPRLAAATRATAAAAARLRPLPLPIANYCAPHPQRTRHAPTAESFAQRRPPDAPQLVWQKPAVAESAAAGAEGFATHSDSSASQRSQALRTPAAAAAPTQSQVQHIARETQRALLLDPSVTDRLAEDVIRKVDKRLRIERERRGL